MSMQAILAASQSLARMQTMQSTRTQMQGTVNIMRAEIKQDGGNKQKEKKADELEAKAGMLMGDLMSEATEVNETLKPSEELEQEAAAKEEAAEKPARSDTVEFSSVATKQAEAGATAKSVASEAVTYKADGSKTPTAPSTPGKAAQTLKATA